MTTVYLIEDDPRLRQGLELLVGGTPGLDCVGAAPDAETALVEALTRPAPDVVLMDIGLPGLSGIEALPRLRALWPSAEVLMLTIQADDASVFDALCAGATGYLLKSAPPAHLLAAIEEARHGGAPMTASIARKVIGAFQRPAPAAEGLTEREREVMAKLVEGKSYRQIADELFVSLNTVSTHVKRVYAKLQVRSRAEVMAQARGRLF